MVMAKDSPLPEMYTERLRLRTLQESDKDVIFSLRSSPIVNRHINRVLAKSENDAAAFIAKICSGMALGEYLYWSVVLMSTEEMIGTICLWNFSKDRKTAELGFESLPAFHGQGYMDEALKAVINYGLQKIELKFIEAYTHRDNRGSHRLLQKNGFIADLEIRDENNFDNVIYTLKSSAHLLKK